MTNSISFVATLRSSLVLMLVVIASAHAGGQRGGVAAGSHVTIPFLANESKPSALEFEGAECDVDATGNAMACEFQQVFLTADSLPADTCLITTNRYARMFRRETPARWTSSDAPAGVCGVVDTATLEDGGGVRWTMRLETRVTQRNAAPECATRSEEAVTLSWRDIRRPLPCRFVQPGGIGQGSLPGK